MPRRKAAKEEDITVDEAPTSIDPYDTLSLSKDATQDQIKTAYRKAALLHHPDKAPASEKELAHTKFQEIAFAYAILSNERRRKRYDLTGRTEESLVLGDDEEDFDWADFFRAQYADVVTTEAIERFEREFKGSEEEREHVLRAYEKFGGNTDKVFEEVMLSDVLEDEERFRQIIDAAIEEGEIEGYKKYTEESEKSRKRRVEKARKRREREAREAEKAAVELEGVGKGKSKGKKDGGMGDLAALIQQRQQGRAENFFDDLEAKCSPKGKKGVKRAMEEPSEEAFAKNSDVGKSKRTKR